MERHLRRSTQKEPRVGERPPGYGYDSLHACVGVSIEALEPADRDRYLKLAVLLEDMAAPLALLLILWGGSERQARERMTRFVSRSMASGGVQEGIRLHDFQHDYVCGEHAHPAALQLQHKALLRSLHVVLPHPEQFAGQMAGRLLSYRTTDGVAGFLEELEENTPRPRLWPPRAALETAESVVLRVLEGHTDCFRAVALDGLGKRAVSGSREGAFWFWTFVRLRLRLGETHSDGKVTGAV